MARFLIIGCGCRGRLLTRALRADGHAVRGTTREPGAAVEIQATGAEAFVGDPDRIATLTRALDHVSVAYVLLGSATGSREQLTALHGTRLEMLLTKMLDTTVHGIVYESAGSVASSILAGGAERIRTTCEDSLIPYALLDADPAEPGRWLEAALAAGRRVIAA